MPRERTLEERVAAIERRLNTAVSSDGDPGSGVRLESVETAEQTSGREGTPQTSGRETPSQTSGREGTSDSSSREGTSDSSSREGTSDSSSREGTSDSSSREDTSDSSSREDTSDSSNREGTSESSGWEDTPASGDRDHIQADFGGTEDEPAHTERTEAIGARLDRLETTVTELQAGLQAVRGYVGNVHHVNESVERRANAAISAVERLESAPKTPPDIAVVESANPVTADEGSDDTRNQGREDPEDGVLDRLQSIV